MQLCSTKLAWAAAAPKMALDYPALHEADPKDSSAATVKRYYSPGAVTDAKYPHA
jgi:hypothetical protein